MQNHYETLGVDINATNEEIARAYRKLSVKYHPDRDPLVKREAFLDVQEAYDVLNDPETKAQYDEMLNQPFLEGRSREPSAFEVYKSIYIKSPELAVGFIEDLLGRDCEESGIELIGVETERVPSTGGRTDIKLSFKFHSSADLFQETRDELFAVLQSLNMNPRILYDQESPTDEDLVSRLEKYLNNDFKPSIKKKWGTVTKQIGFEASLRYGGDSPFSTALVEVVNSHAGILNNSKDFLRHSLLISEPYEVFKAHLNEDYVNVLATILRDNTVWSTYFLESETVSTSEELSEKSQERVFAAYQIKEEINLPKELSWLQKNKHKKLITSGISHLKGFYRDLKIRDKAKYLTESEEKLLFDIPSTIITDPLYLEFLSGLKIVPEHIIDEINYVPISSDKGGEKAK